MWRKNGVKNLLPLLKIILINHGIGGWISGNPNITMEIIKANPDKPWDWGWYI